MRNYRQENRSSNRRYSRKPSMHTVTCDKCGKSCQVPFKPSGDKPVFCDDCFAQQPDRREKRRSGGRNFARRDYKEKKMYTAVCDECGKECEVPFRPTSGKPIYCSDCFEGVKGTSDTSRRSDDNKKLQKQIEALDTKLDEILHLLKSYGTSQKKIKKDSKATSKPRKSAKKKEKTEKPKKRKAKNTRKTTKRKTTAKKSTAKKAKVKKKK